MSKHCDRILHRIVLRSACSVREPEPSRFSSVIPVRYASVEPPVIR